MRSLGLMGGRIARIRASVFGKSENSLFLSVVTTSLALIPAGYAAWISNSVVLLGDFLRCFVECLAIFLSWLIVRRVNRGDRSEFHYGFGKLEQLSGLTVALALLLTSACVLLSAITRIAHPQPLQNGSFGFILSFFSVIGNSYFWRRYRGIAALNSSPVIQSQARLFKAKTVASAVVLISLMLSLSGMSETVALASDPVGSLLLAAFLFRSALELFSASMRDLVDCSIDEAMQLVILRILIKHEALYDGLGSIRTRRSGARIFVELFLQFSGQLQFSEVAKRTNIIQSEVQGAMPQTEVTVVSLETAK